MFTAAAEWVERLTAAHAGGRLHDELWRLGRYPLLVIDEVGYIRREADVANRFFLLISTATSEHHRRVEQPCGEWGSVIPDAHLVAAIVDRVPSTPPSSRPAHSPIAYAPP
jgi:DNA replication protein DnaC